MNFNKYEKKIVKKMFIIKLYKLKNDKFSWLIHINFKMFDNKKEKKKKLFNILLNNIIFSNNI